MKSTLKTLREESGRSRKEVADALNVSVQAISRYELGTRRINIEQVLILATLFDVSEKEVIEAQINSH